MSDSRESVIEEVAALVWDLHLDDSPGEVPDFDRGYEKALADVATVLKALRNGARGRTVDMVLAPDHPQCRVQGTRDDPSG